MEPDPTALGKVHLMAHHTWSDLEVMVEECLLDYCQHLRGTTTTTTATTTPSLSPHLHHTHQPDVWTSPLAPQLEREVGGEGFLPRLLTALHGMRTTTSAMDWNGDSIAGYRLGNVRWRPRERGHLTTGKGPMAMLAGVESMSGGSPLHTYEVFITFKGTVAHIPNGGVGWGGGKGPGANVELII